MLTPVERLHSRHQETRRSGQGRPLLSQCHAL